MLCATWSAGGECLRHLLVVGAIAVVSPAAAAPYQVKLSAPAPLRQLLTEHVDLMRYRNRADVDSQLLEQMAATAPEQVRALASTEGYFSPQTQVRVEQTGSGPVVHLNVHPGPRTRVTDVDIAVSGQAPDRSPAQVAQIRRNWALPAGAPFRQDAWADAKRAGLNTLRQRHYATARIASSEAHIDADEHQAALRLEYASGPRFTFGPAIIEGAERYPRAIAENLNPITAGEDYSAARLLEYQRRLLRSPYYSNATVDIVRDPTRAEGAPVQVQLAEQPLQRLRGAIGYTSDTGASLSGRYSHNSLIRPGWAFDSELVLEQRRQAGRAELALPPRRGGFVDSVFTSVEHSDVAGLNEFSRRVGLQRARNGDQRDTVYALTYYRDRIARSDDSALAPGSVVAAGDHQATVLSVAKTWRRVDDPIFPRSGRVVTAQLGGALEGLLTDQTFVRAYVHVQYYLPVRQRDLVLLRTGLGVVAAKGDKGAVPSSLLFRAGGTGSVRGYPFQAVGTVRNGTVYPARVLATGSAEYQYWFRPSWGAAVFADVGIAGDRFGDKTVFPGVGAGVRWRTPVGRIRADLAYGIRDGKFRPHLALGVDF